ncbi:MAG: alpha-amylase family protein [Anaerolineae bacterium]
MPAHEFPRRAIHLDFHTMPGIYDVGRDFDAAAFAGTLAQTGVDYITVFAKCNLGFAYYPTQVGVPHPGLQQELLGPMLAACHARGIRAAVYLNSGLDHEQAFHHREWCKVNAQGQVYELQKMGHFFRNMCFNTGWADLHLAMIAEVLERYPLDGLFLDCFTLPPCYGAECLEGMAAEGLDWRDPAQATEYTWRVTQRFCNKVRDLVTRTHPGIYLYFNGLPYSYEPTHLELEVLPTGGWGYDVLHWAMRYARTLHKPWFTMTGRFHRSWGDFGGLRPEESLAFDCFNSLANGGTISVGDHMHPRGPLDAAVYGEIGRVYQRVQALEPWTYGAQVLTEIAVLDPALARYPGLPYDTASAAGASRMLLELKQQYDVCDASSDLGRYRVVILPDQVAVDESLADRLRAHLARGGALISSDSSGLTPQGTEFALAEYGLRYLGPEPHNPSFWTPAPGLADGIPAMRVANYTPGSAIEALPGTVILAQLWKPYFNVGSWDGRHENLYCPPEADTGRPALARRGQAAHFSFPIFRAYLEQAVTASRTLLGNLLAAYLPRPLLRTAGLPSFGQATVTSQPGRRMVHLLAYVPELRGKQMQIVEEPVAVNAAEVSLRLDGFSPRTAYLAPERTPLEFTLADGYVNLRVPPFAGHALVVLEG